ncbi:hypothetical protein K2173_018094 [Erythroxylum novogranatense]|uniref:Uncharacterized protein n=1 Tax=Erythroxylum novogranatense TaxID=1862640 RepID=A0AAV8TWV9_9ROSI|nr:hypothetical protein K2173_018094 [Erythroxylum novogranatense]
MSCLAGSLARSLGFVVHLQFNSLNFPLKRFHIDTDQHDKKPKRFILLLKTKPHYLINTFLVVPDPLLVRRFLLGRFRFANPIFEIEAERVRCVSVFCTS